MKCDCKLCHDATRMIMHCGIGACHFPLGAIIDKPKKVSTNMIHARELDISFTTTVTELFELIDLPHRITKNATLSIVPRSPFENTTGTFTLRLEWRGEPE